MGKPYEGELEVLSRTYEWALQAEVGDLEAAVRRLSKDPLIVVGSGGSLTAAHFACYLHSLFTGRLARAMTPYELLSSPVHLGELGVLLLTAGGSNPDILGCLESCVARSPKHLSAVCTRLDTPLAALASDAGWVSFHEFGLPSVKDGFLATNSLLATCVLLARAYRRQPDGHMPLPPRLEDLAHPGRDASAFRAALSEACRPLWDRSTLVVLHGQVAHAGAVDLESKFTEAALGQVQPADYRNFAHGRHHWLAKHGATSGVISLASHRDMPLAKKTISLIPEDVPVVQLDVGDGIHGSLRAIVLSLYIAGEAGLARRIDPGRPSVPTFGRRLYHLNAGYAGRARSLPAAEAAAISRKAGASTATLQARGELPPWREAYATFRGELEGKEFRAVVFDYDGTLCDAAERYDGPGPAVTQMMTELLRAGVQVGIATGRGKSVRKDLLARIESPALRARVLIGYHNGAEIGTLADDSQPPPGRRLDESLEEINALLASDARLVALAKIEAGSKQLTLEFRDCTAAEEVWESVQQGLSRCQAAGVTALRSSHSVDILAPGTTKRRVVDAIRRSFGSGTSPVPVLTIGDRGRWPGNDFALLQEPFSLSVDDVSADPSTCWNLASPGNRCAAALREYFRSMRLGDGFVALNLGSGGGR
ncbi:sucrose-6-phosphate hydrolase [Tautonia sociabilis]|uniref:Sucrose-6-phosphate hydrolase n=1 Tax=Tautonia sociabilis TaxID=2080755 RepID=A0A432MR10_9BACT|nr:sucrose-6-phosphate hydrolase [Tautonia sociabilis]RUL89465.1 sucrose-6-phosphate hydrolase [Tautonia sociabilis]